MNYKWILLVLIITFCGCAEKRWVCYVDRNSDSKCIKVDCIELTESGFFKDCKGYRVMKVYPLKEAIIYRTDPLTDIKKCREHGDLGEK